MCEFVRSASSSAPSPVAEGEESEGTSQQGSEGFVKPKPPIGRLVFLSMCACVCLHVCVSVHYIHASFPSFVSSRLLTAPNPLKQAEAASKSVKKEKDKLKEDRLAPSRL